MEVISIFTSERELVNLFYEFINSFDRFSLSTIDKDTAYFVNKENGKNEIYFHFELNDVENELSYNYSEKDVEYIKKYFDGFPIFLFDVSFRDKFILNDLLQAFASFLREKKKITVEKMLLSHPFDGLKPMVYQNT